MPNQGRAAKSIAGFIVPSADGGAENNFFASGNFAEPNISTNCHQSGAGNHYNLYILFFDGMDFRGKQHRGIFVSTTRWVFAVLHGIWTHVWLCCSMADFTSLVESTAVVLYLWETSRSVNFNFIELTGKISFNNQQCIHPIFSRVPKCLERLSQIVVPTLSRLVNSFHVSARDWLWFSFPIWGSEL